MSYRRLSIWLLGAILMPLLTDVAAAVNTTWTFNGDGNWTDLSNWSNGEPVDSTFNVFIDDGDTPVAVTLNDIRSIGGLTLGADDSLRVEALTSSALSLTSASGFTNDGTISLTGTSSGNVSLAITSGVLTNSATGVLQFQSSGTGSRTFTGDLINNGSISITRPTTFNKAGGSYVNNSQINMVGGLLTISNGGAFEQAGGSFALSGGSGGIVLSGSSTLSLTGGTLNLGGSQSSLISTSSITQTGGTLTATGSGSMTSIVGGAYNMLGGTTSGTPSLSGVNLTVGAGAGTFSFILRSTDTLALPAGGLVAGQTLSLQGTTSVGATVTSATGFHNGGSIELTSTSLFSASALAITSGTLVNDAAGSVVFQAGSGGTRTLTGDFTNSGTVLVDNATTFAKSGGSFSNAGQFTINSGKTLTFTGASNFQQTAGTFNLDGTISMASTGIFTQSGGTVNFGSASSITGGQYSFSGGSMTGTAKIVGGSLSIGATTSGPASFIVQGVSTLSLSKLPAGETLNVQSATTGTTATSASGFTNDGTILLTSTAGFTSTIQLTAGSINNSASGVFNIQSSGTDAKVLIGDLSNDGTVLIGQGAIFNSGHYTNNGQYTISSGQTLSISGGIFDQVAGAFNGGTLALQGSTLNYSGGTFAPSLLTLTTQSNNSKLNILGGSLSLSATNTSFTSTTIHLSGGSFSWSGNLALSGNTFTQDGGVFSITSGTITGGTFNSLGGTINGTPPLSGGTLLNIGPAAGPESFAIVGNAALTGQVNSGQVITIQSESSSSASLSLPSDLTNSGSILLTATSSGGASLSLGTGKTLTNGSTGLLHFQTGGTGSTSRTFGGNLNNNGTVQVDRSTSFSGTNSLFKNNGQFTVAASQTLTLSSSGTTLEQAAGDFDLNGTLSLGSNSLRITGGDFNLNGTVTGATGAAIVSHEGGTLHYNSTNAITAHAFNFLGGTIVGSAKLNVIELNIGPAATGSASLVVTSNTAFTGDVHAGQTLTVGPSPSTVILTAANGFTNGVTIALEDTSQLRITSGALHNGSTGLLRMIGPNDQPTFRGNLVNDGTVVVDGYGEFDKTDGAYTNNNQFTVSSTGHFAWGGTFSQPTGNTRVDGTWGSNGVYNLSGGTFDVEGNGNGTVYCANFGVFNVNGGTLNIDGKFYLDDPFFDGGTLTVSDGGVVELNSNLYGSTGGLGAEVDVLPGGVFHMDGNVVDQLHIIVNGGTFNLTSGSFNSSSTRFEYLGGTINGTPTITGSLTIGPSATNPATFSLNGDFIGSVHAGQTLNTTGDTSGSFTNDGIVRFGGFNRKYFGELTNNGTVSIEGNVVTFNRSNAMQTNAGQLSIPLFQILLIQNSGSYQQTSGATIVNGTLSATTLTRFFAGRLLGDGKIAGPVENIGASVEPGQSVGTLTLQSSYLQQSGGSLIIELGGPNAGQFDVLSIAGLATLAGTLDVRLVDLGGGIFSPVAGNSFPIFTATGGIAGAFQNLLLPTIAPSLAWKMNYSTTALSLVVTQPSDFNGNGTVDAADYLIWRKSLGQSVTKGTGADADFDGLVTQTDYDLWRAHFGEPAGSGSSTHAKTAVPEPATLVFVVLGLVGVSTRQRWLIRHMVRTRQHVTLANNPAEAI